MTCKETRKYGQYTGQKKTNNNNKKQSIETGPKGSPDIGLSRQCSNIFTV